MANTLYRHILKSSWQITSKYKKLWWLGLLIAFLGAGGEYQMLVDYIRSLLNQGQIMTGLQNATVFLAGVRGNWLTILALSLLVAILVVAVLFFFWLVSTCLGSLMKTVADLPADLPAPKSFSIWTKWDEVKGKSNKVLGLFIIAKILTYAILALIITPLLYLTWQADNLTLNIILTFIAFLVFAPLTIIVSFVTKYAAAFVVLQKQRFGEAWVNGWRLFFSNWLISLEMALVLLIINLLVGLAFGLVAILIFSPSFLVGMVQLNSQPTLLGGLVIGSSVIIVILSAFAAAILATFQTTAWTLLFLRLNEPFPAMSKLVRWAAKVPHLMRKFSGQAKPVDYQN